MQNKNILQTVIKNIIIFRVGSAVRYKMQGPKLVHNTEKDIETYFSISISLYWIL